MCRCVPDVVDGYQYYPIIANMFRQCVYTPIELISFWLGMANIACWLVAQFPQVIENYVRGEVEALSPMFMIQWLLGDICNVIGCIFTKQFPTQLYTAYYFVIMDAIMLIQYSWYLYLKPIWYAKETVKNEQKKAWLRKKRDVRDSESQDEIYNMLSKAGGVFSILAVLVILISMVLKVESATGLISSYTQSNQGVVGNLLRAGQRRLLETKSETTICDYISPLSTIQHTIGVISAWISGILYFTARIPQITLNYRRKSVEGLSFGMFFCSVVGNTCYGFSVLLPGIPDWERFAIEVFPYILGSVCTLFTSFIILAQFFYYDYIPMMKKYLNFFGFGSKIIQNESISA